MTGVQTDRLKLVSYNIRKALGTDRRREPERILRVLSALRPDVAVLQEADLRMGDRPTVLRRDLIDADGWLLPLAVARNDVSIGWHGIAVLVGPAVEAVTVRGIDLPGLEPRGAVVADLLTAIGPLRIVGVHLGLLRNSRRQQITAILDHIAELPPMETIIAGDFNEWSERVGLGRLSKGFTIHTPGKSYHARRPVAALDRIAFSAALSVADSGVWMEHEADRASDHLPIWAQIAHD